MCNFHTHEVSWKPFLHSEEFSDWPNTCCIVAGRINQSTDYIFRNDRLHPSQACAHICVLLFAPQQLHNALYFPTMHFANSKDVGICETASESHSCLLMRSMDDRKTWHWVDNTMVHRNVKEKIFKALLMPKLLCYMSFLGSLFTSLVMSLPGSCTGSQQESITVNVSPALSSLFTW